MASTHTVSAGQETDRFAAAIAARTRGILSFYRILAVTSAIFAALAASPAGATGEIVSLISSRDRERLAAFDDTRAKAIAEARAGGSAGELAELDAILAGTPADMTPALEGKWKCRIAKLGGNLPLVIYSWFDCRITEDSAGYRLEKTTGSQRTSGRFFDDGPGHLTYLGTLHYSDERPSAYPAGPERDQVARVQVLTDGRLRFEFPQPYYESLLDIMELRR